MNALQAKLDALLDAVLALLQGSPVRVIGYGSAILIFLVAKASGRIADVSFADAVSEATVAITLVVSVVEGIRHFAFSPATAGAMQATIDALTLQAKLNQIAPVPVVPTESVTPAPDDPQPAADPAPVAADPPVADPQVADLDTTGTGDS